MVVALQVKNALRLAAVNDAAARLGLRVGMALADAKAMYPGLALADADPDADQGLLAAIADWCDRYTPLIGLDPPDGLMLDITGCAHLFGGEAAFGGDIVQRLGRQGFAARAAIADTVGCAWAVARHGGKQASHIIVPPGGTHAALLPLRLTALRKTEVVALHAGKARGDGTAPVPRTRMVMFPDGKGLQPASVYSRQDLLPGHRFSGPAIVEEYGSTTVIPPRCEVEIDDLENIIINVEA